MNTMFKFDDVSYGQIPENSITYNIKVNSDDDSSKIETLNDRISKLEAQLLLHEQHTVTNEELKTLQMKVEFLEHEVQRLSQETSPLTAVYGSSYKFGGMSLS